MSGGCHTKYILFKTGQQLYINLFYLFYFYFSLEHRRAPPYGHASRCECECNTLSPQCECNEYPEPPTLSPIHSHLPSCSSLP